MEFRKRFAKHKGLLWPLSLLFLFSCTSSHSRWNYDHSAVGCGRLFYPAHDCFNGISVECIRNGETLLVYLDIYTFEIASDPAVVILDLGEVTYQFEGFRLEGYQKILLPLDARDTLVNALLCGTPVWIQIDGYSELVDSTGFAAKYQKLAI